MQISGAWRLTARVFLPFAVGYYLSYLFRTINALIASHLSSDAGLGAADLGLLTSVYFLVFAAAQIPVGILLDRFGPRRVQSALLLLAAVGAGLFAVSSGFPSLLIARAMIGLGVAAALTAGLKSIILWFPSERVVLLNGYMIMLGSLGAVTATAPVEYLLAWMGWRLLFGILAVATGATAILIYVAVPERGIVPSTARATLGSVFSDRRFWRMAPLSATCVGSAWSLQGLWASPWLTDVEGLDRASLVRQLFTMSIVLSFGALLFGMTVHYVKRRGIGAETVLATVAVLFFAAELALILRVPLPSILPWSVVAIARTATVVSFAVIVDYFPPALAGRANGALNVLHFGWAFLAQCGTGLILEQWPANDGHRAVHAYQVAFGVNVAVQIAALIWFMLPWRRSIVSWMSSLLFFKPADVSYAVESYEDSVLLVPADDDAEW
ncbi:MFS transporter [Bradyrhizobium japonicum]|uniref:MFS transporter n=1 Tax=Bradyrhizobium japonicum TaxID=375 RepID=UPI000429E718|nr:MFS transporter [Bradyrhizobium japonicum]MCP1748241.1 MFS family permease [Bradyrhizobium japonicum]MCP1866163.1 MFS family permease [Bradyrhizobium japonicum]MCP1896745.1 MFS family permease [Bradyrhizobium japonicum]MCW2330134.1 MFS family permease [Bradyrhizobium japonicum]WLB96473.1 MFS transporter [Bradyrhizobium japonicum USDA 123]